MRTRWQAAALAAALTVLIPAADASPSRSSAVTRQNIVFILTDDQSVDSIAKMPYVNGFKTWITFKNAFINDPMCCPSRATIATGLNSQHTGIENNEDRSRFDDSSTVATWLHAAGYRTALIGKYHLGSRNGGGATYIPPGWDYWATFPDGAYYNYTLNINGKLVHYGSTPQDYSTDVLADMSVKFISNQTAGKPFFLYYATRSPHDAYQPAVRYTGRFKNTPIPHTPNFNEADMSDKPSWWRGLAPRKVPDIDIAHRQEFASLLAVDDGVKAIFAELRKRGFLKNTIVVFMTDNGVAFGEHRWRGKACAYEPCIRTPLLVAYPGEKRRTVSALVSNADIAPTFADIAHAKPTIPVDGHSLLPLITGATPKNWPNRVLLRWKYDQSQAPESPPSFWGIRTPRYKYVLTLPSNEEELYDLSKDPDETQSVVRDASYTKVEAVLQRRLTQLRTAAPHRVTQPDTRITSGPSARAGRTVVFRFRASKSGSVFQCRLSRAVLWSNCKSPQTYRGLAARRYVFQVRAIDAFGNSDWTPAKRSFRVS